MMKSKQGHGGQLFTTDILNPNVRQGDMHKYERSDGYLAILNHRDDEITTIDTDGKEWKWKKADHKIVVPSAEVVKQIQQTTQANKPETLDEEAARVKAEHIAKEKAAKDAAQKEAEKQTKIADKSGETGGVKVASTIVAK